MLGYHTSLTADQLFTLSQIIKESLGHAIIVWVNLDTCFKHLQCTTSLVEPIELTQVWGKAGLRGAADPTRGIGDTS